MMYVSLDIRCNVQSFLGTIFCTFDPPPPPLETWKIKTLIKLKKKKKSWNYCHLHHKCINKNHTMYGSWDMECDRQNFSHFGPFLPFYSPNNLKNDNFDEMKKKKSSLRYYHFIHVYHKWKSYDVFFLRYKAWKTNLFVILDHFLSFYFTSNPLPKIKILKKWNKNLEISSF